MPRARLATPLLALLCAVASVSLCVAQEGAYRSRVILTQNEGDWAAGAELSVEELELQLDSLEAGYTKASAGRHLARHYVEQKDYSKAIDYYQQALSENGLSDVANREMLRELAQVYLLRKDYGSAVQALRRSLDIDLVPEVEDFLLLARAQHHLQQYADVVATLDGIETAGLTLNTAQMQLALSLYFSAGAFSQSEVLLRRLLVLEPENARHWHLLTSVYLKQNKKKKALDQLTLARDKRVPFSERDILLLASLHAANNNPYGAALVLENALSAQALAASAATYRKLFEYWLQAREREKAIAALQLAATTSRDIELFLYLAQLQMEQEKYASMEQTMVAACDEQLPAKYVGRANLLLGISRLKLGDEEGARRALINATLTGGVNAEAGKWLRFMAAAPPTVAETRRIVGICYGPNDKGLKHNAS